MATFQPADTLRNRTFLGLLVAQFFAAFNDQAIHASAMFFAINRGTLDEAGAITLMPILFYAPWALFCTFAGYLADRYSKRSSLVAWKVAEVGITLIALAGFWMGTHGRPAGAWVVLSTVFLMGMHSAFFVPAKYGVMPEILKPHMLSRGNGVLESLSFLAVILGTVFGGILSFEFRGSEYFIGAVLVALAVLGAAASLLIGRVPAANPARGFPPYLYKPLFENIRALFRSRPLAFATVGIAFFTFLVAFMRATVYLHGQVQSPPWPEYRTSEIVGMVALGIGLGSPVVGYLSGGKVEVGLVPIGALGMVLAMLVAAATLGDVRVLVACITLIGLFTGFYIVPLFTLLQLRAPKASKGDFIATSNFINVVGAIVASLVLFSVNGAAKRLGVAPALEQTEWVEGVLAADPEYEEGRPHMVVLENPRPLSQRAREWLAERGNPTRLPIHSGPGSKSPEHQHQLYLPEAGLIDAFGERLKAGDRVVESHYRLGDVFHHHLRLAGTPQRAEFDLRGLPRLLFVGAGLLTLFTLFLLWRQMPDLFLRTVLWARAWGRSKLRIHGVTNLPGQGPAVLVTNAGGPEACLQVLSATDRTTHFVLPDSAGLKALPEPERVLAGPSVLDPLPAGGADAADGDRLGEKVRAVLRRREVLGLALPDGDGDFGPLRRLYDTASAHGAAPVVPVYWEEEPGGKRRRHVYVVFGKPLPPGTPAEAVGQELERLREELQEGLRNGHGAAAAAAH
jgi:MFS family permease